MPLLAYGINHQTAPIAVREKLAFSPETIPDTLKALTAEEGIEEAVIISTCNRTEIYANLSTYFPLQQWLQKEKEIKHIDLSAYDYAFHDIDAVRHMMRVASGLDSMVLGEPQIFGQIKQAYQFAQEAGTIGVFLQQLFPAIFQTSKHIRTNTDICTHPVSLAYTITQLAKKLHGDLSGCHALLVGSGEMIELVARHLHQNDIKNLTFANRTIEKTQALADTLQGTTHPISHIPELLPTTDIVISATRSQLPIIGKGMLETATNSRKPNPLLLVDLAVPRDIEAESAALDSIHLYNIDDLQEMIASNLENRQQAAAHAESLIELKATEFLQALNIRNAQGIITDFRRRLESMRDTELEKALSQLANGVDPQIVLEQFARGYTKKILHQPTVKLRQAASEAQTETLQLAKHLFELE